MSVLVVGDIITDIIVIPEGPLVRGSDRRATIRSRPGGSAANLAIWLASFGVPVRFAARVGAADLETHRTHLARHNVTPLLAPDPDLPSGVLISIIDPDGERSFLTDRGANLNLSAVDLPVDILDGQSRVSVSGYCFFADRPRAAVMTLLKAARARGIPTSIDPASVGFLREIGPDSFLRWAREAGIGTILANADEARELSGASEINEQMQTLGRSFERVVIKRGSAGAALGGASGVLLSLPAPSVDVVDTTGAGDAFAAGFIAADLEKRPPEACLQAGIAAGSRAVTAIGGQPTISGT